MTNYQIIIHKFEHKTILEKHISKFLPRKNLDIATYIQDFTEEKLGYSNIYPSFSLVKTWIYDYISKFLLRKNLDMATYIQHIYIRYITIVNKSQQDQYNSIPARFRPTLA